MNGGIRVINDIGRFAMIPVALLTDSSMSSNARLLYGILWSFSDATRRESRPGRKTLAELLGASVDTVDRATRELIDSEWLSVESAFDGARQTANVYRLLAKGAAPVRRGGRTTAADGGRTTAAQEQEPEEQEPEEQGHSTLPKAVDNSEPFCSKHMPYGPSGKPCRGCADAKRAYEHAKRKPTPIPPRGPVDPESCDHKFVGGWCVWCPTPQVVLV